ncbi:MAG: nitroreductase family protein [Planctomycetota bacterium]
MNHADLAAVVETVIRRRKTEKVLADVDAAHGVAADAAVEAERKQTVRDAVLTAGWAPFHYPRNVEGLAEPWRAHVLWREDAHRLARYLRDDLQTTTKAPNLAAGCDALVLVTWLPEAIAEADASLPGAGAGPNAASDKQRRRDEEHLAATAAMVQNLLLLLTAHGMGTYWSSGGKLGEPAVFDHLGIAAGERLLAAVFVEYRPDESSAKQRVAGKLRDKRGDGWIREVTAPSPATNRSN